MLSISHILIIVIAAIFLFGSKKFPEVMKNLAIGLKSFKNGFDSDHQKIRTKSKNNNKK